MTAPQKKRLREINAQITEDERAMATEVMAVVFDLARSAYRARARLLSEGYAVEPIPNEPQVVALLGITQPAPQSKPEIEVVKKPGLIAATKEQAKRLLS